MSDSKISDAFKAVTSKLFDEGLPLYAAIPLAIILPPPLDIFTVISSWERHKRENNR